MSRLAGLTLVGISHKGNNVIYGISNMKHSQKRKIIKAKKSNSAMHQRIIYKANHHICTDNVSKDENVTPTLQKPNDLKCPEPGSLSVDELTTLTPIKPMKPIISWKHRQGSNGLPKDNPQIDSIDNSADISSMAKVKIKSLTYNDSVIRPDHRSAGPGRGKSQGQVSISGKTTHRVSSNSSRVRGSVQKLHIPTSTSTTKIMAKSTSNLPVAHLKRSTDVVSFSERNRMHNFFLNKYIINLSIGIDNSPDTKQDILYERTRDRLAARERMKGRSIFLRLMPELDKSLDKLKYGNDLKNQKFVVTDDSEALDRFKEESQR